MGFATVLGGKPQLPLIEPPLSSTSSLPTCGMEKEPPYQPINGELPQYDLYVTDQRLQELSKTMDQENLSQQDRAFLSAGIATTQHRLANLLGDLELNKTCETSSFTRKSSYLAALIYINLSLREILPKAELHSIMVSRLKAIMKEGGTNILSTWNSSPQRLLWVAFIGGSAALKRPDKVFFIDILRQLKRPLQISSLGQFQDPLKAFGWLRSFSEPHSVTLWLEMGSMAFAGLLA